MDSQKTCEILKRSKLYRLEPQGIGTAYIEALSSYVNRLAVEHCVTAKDLLSEVIAPVINKSYITKGTKKTSDPFYTNSYKINNNKREAHYFVLALEELTCATNLKWLTMIPFNHLPSKGLLKSHQAWCPLCFLEWKHEDKALYTPLLWHIKEVECCSIHKVLLEVKCSKCQSTIRQISPSGQNGICPKCGEWLIHTNTQNRVKQLSDYQLWISREFGEVLRYIQERVFNCDRDNIRNNIAIMVRLGKNIAGFSKTIGISKSTMHGWCHEINTPTIEYLLRICYLFNVNISEVLFTSITFEKLNTHNPCDLPPKKNKQREAKHFNYQNLKFSLYKLLHTEFNQSLERVASQLEVSSKTLRKYFPEECAFITNKYLINRKTKRQEREDMLVHIIKNLISDLTDKKIFPGRDLVEKRIGKPFALKKTELHEIWVRGKTGYFE